MEVKWNDHTLKVTGSWAGRWLYLAPDYELWLDDQRLDRSGGPRVRPRLEAVYEDASGELHHIEADLVSIVGIRPLCEISVEGNLLAAENVRVQNLLNPLLIMVIAFSTVVMLYVGPEVLRGFL
ncbi:MAG: hypothetical protein H0U74_11035 [Bradymonadaceae bacterium]|nr:hypothetical protein [Lujinxingiaceae bacterium]